ncbi:MAG: hypothetical protein WD749_07015 [Phycisphaerales bacterium]
MVLSPERRAVRIGLAIRATAILLFGISMTVVASATGHALAHADFRTALLGWDGPGLLRSISLPRLLAWFAESGPLLLALAASVYLWRGAGSVTRTLTRRLAR